jgi:hypothetical protein
MDCLIKMKKKYKITFEVDASYPYIDKYLKRMSKDFDDWLKEWATSQDVVPLLFQPGKNGSNENIGNAHIKVKIVRDKEVILDAAWDQLSDDF